MVQSEAIEPFQQYVNRWKFAYHKDLFFRELKSAQVSRSRQLEEQEGGTLASKRLLYRYPLSC